MFRFIGKMSGFVFANISLGSRFGKSPLSLTMDEKLSTVNP